MSNLTRRAILRGSTVAAAAAAASVLPAIAVARTGAPALLMPSFGAALPASEAELLQRYLAFLSIERRYLAREIGNACAGGGIYRWEDSYVDGFHEVDGRGGLLIKASSRAVTVLTAIGVSLEHDPEHFIFGEEARS
jgi:hypothetical protein